MNDILEKIGVGIIVLGVVSLLGFLLAFPVMWLWDAIMPELFGLSEITYLQALGLFVLLHILLPTSSGRSKS
jgi:hypothetical protein